MEKIIEYYFDDMERPIKTESLNSGENKIDKNLISLGCNVSHGYHKLKVRLYQSVNDTKGIEVPSLEWELATYVDGNYQPIIWLGDYKSEFYIYEAIQIPFKVYNPNNPDEVEAHFKKDGYEMTSQSPQTITDMTKFSYFEIPDAEENKLNKYSISCGEDENQVEREIEFRIVQDTARPDYKIQDQSSLRYLLNTVGSGRSNAETKDSRETLEYVDARTSEQKVIRAKFENFNWLNNGWVKDADNKTCLRISNGAKLSIPVGEMTFASPAEAMTKSNHTIELGFKMRNIQDYSNLIKTVSRYNYELNGETKNDNEFYFKYYGYKYTQVTGAFNPDVKYYAKSEENDYEYTEVPYSDLDTSKTYYTRSATQVYKTNYTNYDSFLTWYFKNNDVGIEYDDLKFAYTQKQMNLDNVVCGYYSGDTTSVVGLCVGPQDAFFSNGRNTVNVSFVEDEFTTLSLVYSNTNKFIFIYLNGVLTSVIKSTINDSAGFTINNDVLEINSAHCDIDLYKVRMYDTALDVNSVVINYAVDLNDVNIYDQNKQLTNFNQVIQEYQLEWQKMIDYNTEHPQKPLMPYIIFDTNGKNDNKLSFAKSNNIPITVTFVNTPLDVAYAQGELDELAGVKDGDSAETKAEKVKDYYLHHCPSWTGENINMSVQGTSSEFYPRRNYKLKTKTEYDMVVDQSAVDAAVKENENWTEEIYKADTNIYKSYVHIFLNKGPFAEDYQKDMDGLDHEKNPKYILSSTGFDAKETYYTDSEGKNKITLGTGETPYEYNKYYIKNKNYVEFGKETTRQKYFYMDNNTCGTTKFTMKIDFMESSGTYNMGFANLVKNAYSKHPLEDLNTYNAVCIEEVGGITTATSYDPNATYQYLSHKGEWKTVGDKDNLNIKNEEDFNRGPYGLALTDNVVKVFGGTKKSNVSVVDKDKLTFNDLSALSETEKEQILNNIKETAETNADKAEQATFEKGFNKWFTAGKEYPAYKFENLDDYRTSVQGFRVMAFHKKAENDYTYIGMYNMLIDKGSDECYGFKTDKTTGKTTLQKYLPICELASGYDANETYYYDKEGKKPANVSSSSWEDNKYYKVVGYPELTDITECWEFENNSRTYCSFRDPLQRKDLSFDFEENGSPALNAVKSAPRVADSFEYRFSNSDDILDYIVDPIKNSSKLKSDAMVEYMRSVHKDLSFSENETKNSPNLKARFEFFLDKLKNWERACQWVWSTCVDEVVSQGDYTVAPVGNLKYESGKYYILTDDNTFELDTREVYTPNEQYYSPLRNKDTNEHIYHMDVDENGKQYEDTEANKAHRIYEYTRVAVCSEAYLYEANKFYIVVNNIYVLDGNEKFTDNAVYYELKDHTDEEFENEYRADKLVIKCEKYNPNVTYYTYDGAQKCGYAVNKVASSEVNETNCGNYYVSATSVNANGETVEGIIYGGHVYRYDTKEYRLAKFKAELSSHFDIEYMATYFVMTEVFECYDSRGKNCMMASWGPQHVGGDYIWYPIFYDIDTQLGINNTGIPSFEYNVDATIDGNFSTSDSVLWNNFYTVFKSQYIIPKYRHLKGLDSSWKALTNPPLKSIDNIEGWYNTDPNITGSIAMKGDRPIIAKNLDEYYKYITITNSSSYKDGTTGHLSSNDNGDYVYDADCTYFYALQGDRSTSRRQFLTNRLEYIDSWLNEGNYKRGGNNRIRGRIAANNPSKTSDKWVETELKPYYSDAGYGEEGTKKSHRFDAEYWLNLEPTHSSYVTLGDDNEAYPSQKYDGITPLHFTIDAIKQGVRRSQNYPEQLLYIYGMNHMKDVGDMSNLYWQEFYIEGDAHTLTSLKLGYDGLDEEGNKWKNNNVNGLNLGAGANADPGLPLLKELNLSNIQINAASVGGTTLDLTTCEKLENFRATGSNFENFTFADGVALNTLYLPSSTKQLILREARLLKNLIDDYETPEYDNVSQNLNAKPGLWIEGFTDTGNTNLIEIELAGGGLKYDSYKLLNRFYNLTKSNTALQRQLRFTNVEWSPFTLVGEKDVLNANKKYYLDDGHYGLIENPYGLNSNEMATAIANKEIYVKDGENSAITDITLLENLITGSQYVKNGQPGNDVPEITGSIYIDNEEYYKVDTSMTYKDLNTTRNCYYLKSGSDYTNYIANLDSWNTDKENLYYRIKESYVRSVIQANYPKLTIFFAHIDKAYTAKYVRMDERDNSRYDSTFEIHTDTLELSDKRYFTNPYEKGWAKAKDHYDFIAWSTSKDDTGADTDTGHITNEQWKAKTVDDIDKDKHTYVFYAIYKPQTFSIDLSKAYRPSRGGGLKGGLIFGTSMRKTFLSTLDEFTTDAEYDNDSKHTHYFDSSDLLLEKKKCSLLGYRLRPDKLKNNATNEWEHLYFNATKDDILFGFNEQYDTKIQKNITVMPVVDKTVSVYNNIYSHYELTGNNQYYNFTPAPKNIKPAGTGYWISKIRGIAGTFTNVLTIPNGAYRGQEGWTIVKGIVVNVSDEGYKDKIIDDCSIIKAIFFEPPTAEELKKGYGITHIGNYAFEGWTSLEQIELPDTLTYIGENAFAGCENLTSLTIGSQSKPFSSLDNIKTGAFNKTGLQMLTIYATDVGASGYSYEAYGKNWGLKLPDDGGPQVSVEKVSF